MKPSFFDSTGPLLRTFCASLFDVPVDAFEEAASHGGASTAARAIDLEVAHALNVVGDESQMASRLRDHTEHFAYGPAASWRRLNRDLHWWKEPISTVLAAVREAPAHAWWWSDVDRGHQRWIRDAETPLLAGRVGSFNSAEDWLSTWWSVAPISFEVPKTSRGPLPSVHLAASLARGGHELLEAQKVDLWDVTVPTHANVYEVKSVSDWAALVAKHGLGPEENSDWDDLCGQTSSWIYPDWKSIAQDYDGVHIALGAYLESSFLAIPVPGKAAQTALIGWNADETVWLRRQPTAREEVGTFISAEITGAH